MWVASVNDDVLPETTNSDYEIEYVDIGSVSLDRGIERTERINFAGAPSRARRLVRDGDILVSTVRTYLKAIAPVVTPPGNLVVSTGFAVVRPALQLLSRYGKYALQATGFVDEVISRSTGVSYPAINASDLVRICVPIPPAEEQSAIAAFLDRETAKIDALITEQEKLIALLAEKRQVTISHAVTKGLNPDAPMKDSGIVWLGDVPAHWDVGKIQSFAKRESGHTPSRQHPEYWEGCTIPWFSLADVWQIRSGNVKYVNETKELVSELGLANSSARLLPRGTVILSRTASVGYSAIMGCEMATTQDFVNWICKQDLLSEFLLYVLRGMQPEFNRLMMGSAHQTIYMADIAKLMMAKPPVEEQEEIINFLEIKVSKLDTLKDEAETGIGLLKERRNALIAAAVTGKIDVRGKVENIAI
ncbi:restriction endonuclease subunit S [Xanthomonas cannabis]|uniref:restriction endonuclease subunit S n=1 Tax=Xanthomonas cannabis TaxID=1885674 RepID=UPI0033A79D6D